MDRTPQFEGAEEYTASPNCHRAILGLGLPALPQSRPASFASYPVIPSVARFIMLLAAISLIANVAKAHSATATTGDLDNPRAQASYTIGFNLGSSLHKDQIDIDPQVLASGLRDAVTGNPPQLEAAEMAKILADLQTNVKSRRQVILNKVAADNAVFGRAFLKTNGARRGVTTLPSGLEYEVLVTGHGRVPKDNDTVQCNYRGTTINGVEFDSSTQHGGSTELPVSGVIAGWREALTKMPAGSKWRLFVPADLAYGAEGRPPAIGPNATLIFDLELIDIEDQN